MVVIEDIEAVEVVDGSIDESSYLVLLRKVGPAVDDRVRILRDDIFKPGRRCTGQVRGDHPRTF